MASEKRSRDTKCALVRYNQLLLPRHVSFSKNLIYDQTIRKKGVVLPCMFKYKERIVSLVYRFCIKAMSLWNSTNEAIHNG